MKQWKEERQAGRVKIATATRNKKREKNRKEREDADVLMIGQAQARRKGTTDAVSSAVKEHKQFVDRTQGAGYQQKVSAATR